MSHGEHWVSGSAPEGMIRLCPWRPLGEEFEEEELIPTEADSEAPGLADFVECWLCGVQRVSSDGIPSLSTAEKLTDSHIRRPKKDLKHLQ